MTSYETREYVQIDDVFLFFVFQLMKSDDDSDSGTKQVLEACKQIADCLVDRLLTLEEKVVGKKLEKLL